MGTELCSRGESRPVTFPGRSGQPAVSTMLLRRRLVSLRQQQANLGKMAIPDRAVFNGPALLAWCRWTDTEITAHRGHIGLPIAPKMSRGGSDADVPNMLAQPGKRFAITVVQDAYEEVHDLILYGHTPVNLYSIRPGCKAKRGLIKTEAQNRGERVFAPRRTTTVQHQKNCRLCSVACTGGMSSEAPISGAVWLTATSSLPARDLQCSDGGGIRTSGSLSTTSCVAAQYGWRL